MFEPILGKTMDAYIDDMVVKSRRESDHIRDLTEVFMILKRQTKAEYGIGHIRGKLQKILGALGDKRRDQSKSKINHNNQQPRQPKDCEGGSEIDWDGSSTKQIHQ